MASRDSSSSIAGFIAEAPPRQEARAWQRRADLPAWARSPHPADANERAAQRRARRQALLLMALSSVISLAALYGLWSLLRSVV